MFRKLLLALALAASSFTANALTSTADSYLVTSNTYAASAHWAALRAFYYNNAGFSSLGRSYAAASRNYAWYAYQQALDSYYNGFTTDDYYAQLNAYYTWLNTRNVVIYWYSNKPAAFSYARTADIRRADAFGFVNYSWGSLGDH